MRRAKIGGGFMPISGNVQPATRTDPITNGHVDVIRRGVQLFDELIVAVGINPEKKEMFSLEDRVRMAREILSDIPGVSVESYSGLTVDFVRKTHATALLRGIRDVS